MQDKKKKYNPRHDAPKKAPEQEAPAATGDVEIIGINFREAGKIYYFAPAGLSFRVGDRVIVETSRGIEMGTVKVANKVVPSSEIVPPLKSVMRKATESDLLHDKENHEREMEAAIICKRKIQEHKLEMSLVAV